MALGSPLSTLFSTSELHTVVYMPFSLSTSKLLTRLFLPPPAFHHHHHRPPTTLTYPIQYTQEQLLDVLRALSSPNLDIRRKTLDIALDLITSRNIDEVRGSCDRLTARNGLISWPGVSFAGGIVCVGCIYVLCTSFEQFALSEPFVFTASGTDA